MTPRFAHGLCVLAGLLAPGWAHAESMLVQGSGDATAHVNFRVVVGRVLHLAVGSGSTGAMRNVGTVNTARFNYTANPTAVGTGATAASVTGANVRVRVYGNNGPVTLSVSHPASLTSGTQTIPMSQIAVTSTSAALPAPAMNGAPVAVVANSPGGRVTNRVATWRFRYLNTVTPGAGTYSAQVTYTASMP